MTAAGLPSAAVAAALAEHWGLTAAALEPNRGGMNSETWFAQEGGARFVAKAVPLDRAVTFEAGLTTAALVEAAGIRAGAPVAARDGRSCVRLGDRVLALLQYVPGDELTGDTEGERALIGSTLGRAHLALAGHSVPGAHRFHWLDPAAPHLDIRPWVRPAVAAAIDRYLAIPPDSLIWGLLHTDPAPEAFRVDRTTGEVGLIDWDLGLVGPLLYDLASAEMYVGGAEYSRGLIDAYLATGALDRAELDRALRPMARMRWAVQADYFAGRIARNDRTGIDDPAENEEGLEDARRALAD